MTRGWIFILALAFLSACSKEEEPATAPTASDFEKERAELAARVKGKRPSINQPKKRASETSRPDQTEFAVVDQEYVYTSEGKRDPFRSFILDATNEREDSRGPLEQFDLAQLSVVAVVWGTDNPRAVVNDPSGRGYIVREGTYMGKNEGRVIAIADNALTVKETYVDYFGETTTKDVTMRVRVEKEGDRR
jgi:type IV pilus assembly protein PilP